MQQIISILITKLLRQVFETKIGTSIILKITICHFTKTKDYNFCPFLSNATVNGRFLFSKNSFLPNCRFV